MAISYSWKVETVKTQDQNQYKDAVVIVYWKKIGTDEYGRTASFSSVTSLTTDNSLNNFVPFEILSEATILGWIKEKVTPSLDANMNATIEKAISRQPY